MKPGDVIAYDYGTSFLGELWTPDVRNRVVYVAHQGDDQAYLESLRAVRPVWVAAAAGSPAERLIQGRPEQFEHLFALPMSPARMYRVRTSW